MSHNRMVELLEIMVPEEGIKINIIEDVNLFRITKSTPRNPQEYDPSIIILAQGHKRLFIGDEEFIYDPLNYLVLSVPLPVVSHPTDTEG